MIFVGLGTQRYPWPVTVTQTMIYEYILYYSAYGRLGELTNQKNFQEKEIQYN